MKITTVELMRGDESLGHAPIIHEKGKRAKMVIGEDNKPKTFDTVKDAREYGKEFANEIVKTESDEG